MAVNLNIEKKNNLYSIVMKGSIQHPVIWSGIDHSLITKKHEQMGYTYKVADYKCNFAYAETKIEYWSQVGISKMPDKLHQILYVSDIRDIDICEYETEDNNQDIYLLLDSNVHIHLFDYIDHDDQYKSTDCFLGCGLRLTTLAKGESIIVSQKDVWADRLFVYYGRLGLGAKVVSFDYNRQVDWDHLIPWDIV